MLISKNDVARVTTLYNRGLYLQAYKETLALAPLSQWEGTDALLIAGRLAGNLGAPKLSRRLHLSAWRKDRVHPEAIYYNTRALLDSRGPWRAWMFARQYDDLTEATPDVRCDWLALRAALLGQFRDFDAADELIARAEQIAPDNPWLWIEKSTVLEYEDRYEESLAAAQRSLDIRPLYRPAVQTVAHLLSLLEREAEACELLEESVRALECPSLLTQLAQLQIDREEFSAARANLERALEWSLLLEDEMRQWFNSRLSDAVYLCGEWEASAALAEQTGSPFFEEIAKRLRTASPEMKRTLLPVGFIRQHHVTCAPATLTTISRYWQAPAEHLNIAEQICYGGTTDHSERKWAEENGWEGREFCVNWEDLVNLIDRGAPFTMATVEPGNAHLQSVVGYDERRGTLLIRDPYNRGLGEGLAKEMLEHYRASGPRGMAMVPREKAALLEGLKLKEADLYDRSHWIQRALAEHRRDEAEQHWQSMSEAAAEHRLTLNGRLAIAWYDDDQVQVLKCVEKLLEQFPEDANLKLQKLSCLRVLARQSERLNYLKTICRDEKSDPLFWEQYAQELSEDAREQRAALRLLHRSIRARPLDANSFYQLAHIRWSQREFEEALQLYRFAACLKDTNEGFVRSYFLASRHLRRTAEALHFLDQRFVRFGRRSGFPARTLSQSYEQTGQVSKSLDVLQRGLELRPDDGDLLLYASDAFARQGDFETAGRLLAKAEGKASRTQWLRGAALIAAYRGELHESLKLWRQVLAAEPLALDANRNVAQLLGETESPERAIESLREATMRFPHSLPLHQLLIDWLRDDPVEVEKVVRHMIDVEPANAWLRRELALKLCQQRRHEEALEAAVLGRELEPESSGSHYVIGLVHTEMGNLPLAKQAFREAISLSVDHDYAINELIGNSHTVAERREALEFIRQELIRQVTYGDGLFAYRQVARTILDDAETLQLLRSALETRPDLWHAWSAVVHQLIDMQQLDEALDLAQQSTQRFSLLPRVWLDLAYVHQVRLNNEGLIEALLHARRINPTWSVPAQQLAEAYQRSGDFQKGQELMEQAIAASPLDHTNYGYLAEILWLKGERERAIDRLRRALALEPGYDWAWRVLRDWSSQMGQPELAVDCARELTEQRPGHARSWLVLAQTEGQSSEDRLAAVERAIELNPRLIESHTLRSKLLTAMRKYDEARAACRPEVFGENRPADLRIAEAGVDADRGDLPAAIRQLESLTKDEPNNFGAWNLLADWYRATEAKGEYLEAARQMARLVPHRSITLGYLSDAYLWLEERESAKESLRRAIALDPGYEFAGATLFDLQLEDQDLDGAEETIKVLRQQVGGDVTTLRELLLALKHDDLQAAGQSFRALCLSETQNPAFIRNAADDELYSGWKLVVDNILNEVLTLPEANFVAGVVWAERHLAHQEWDACASRLNLLERRDKLWEQSVIAFIEGLIKAGQKHRLRQFIEQNREDLSHNLQTWGNVGYAFYSIGEMKTAINWLSDWEQRAELEPWMLWNYTLALRDAKRQEESYRASCHALNLPPDDLTQSHALIVSYDELMRGDWMGAIARLQKINEPTLREWDRDLFGIVTDLQEYYSARNNGGNAHGDAVMSLIRTAEGKKYSDLLKHFHRRAVLKIANDHGGGLFLVWAHARLLWLSVT